MTSLWAQIASLPRRPGPRPRTAPTNPHQQLDQNAPPDLQEAVFLRASSLPGVQVAPSGISVPGARAFVLAATLAKGPPEAFMVGREFAHLHPSYDGSLHAMLPRAVAALAVEKGWAEAHPVVRRGWLPPTAVMIFGPRDSTELDVVWCLVQASYWFARGEFREDKPN